MDINNSYSVSELPSNHPMVPYINYVLAYSMDCLDWFKLKTQIINVSPPKVKGSLSRRHFSTKKHIVSHFDKQVIAYIEKSLGKSLFIDSSKLHDPSWTQKPRGWGLSERNRLAKEHAAQKQK